MISLASSRTGFVIVRFLLFKNSIAGFISEVSSYPIVSKWETKSQRRSKVINMGLIES